MAFEAADRRLLKGRAMDLRAPFPWFGGKSRAASLIWERLGEVANYVEPFAGSLAVLLGAPKIAPSETVNDKDGFVANFWRALSMDCEAVEHHADWPVNENDLHARHAWLVEQRVDLTARLEGDPEFFDAKIAGWWVWGICCWIGSGWCSGKGPWSRVDGKLVLGNLGQGVNRKLVHLGRGVGVESQRVHLGDLGQGVNRKRVELGGGRGVNRQLVHLGDLGRGVNRQLVHLGSLAERLRRVRVCCGDWTRVLGPTPTFKLGITGVVLDPPYDLDIRRKDCYSVDEQGISAAVRAWAIENGSHPLFRIALCGYEGEHEMPDGWRVEEWKAHGGYSSESKDGGNGNEHLERIWFSPHCLSGKQGRLF